MRLLILLFLLISCSSENWIDTANEESLKKVTANKTVNLKIILNNGVVFKDAFIKEKTTTSVFNNTTFERENKPSVIISRSYGRVNIAIEQIKSISTSPADKSLCMNSVFDHTFLADMLEMIEISDLNNPEKFNDAAAKHLGELAPVLQELYLQGGTLTDKSVEILAKLKRLTHLSLNKSFSEKGLNELKKKLPLTRVRK